MRIEHRLGRMAALTAVAAAWLVALTVALPAKDVDPLQMSGVRLGAGRVTALRVAGFGAAYLDAAGRLDGRAPDAVRHPIARYAAAYDYRAGRVEASVTLVDGAPAGAIESAADLLASPQGFVSRARLAGAAVRPTAAGTEVSFDAGWFRYTGLLTPDGDVDRVRVSRRDGVEARATEVRYRDYETAWNGVRFPRHVVESRDGAVVLDLWIADVDAVWSPVRDLAFLRAPAAGLRSREAAGGTRGR